jgi:SAM-dependent methyltransferase
VTLRNVFYYFAGLPFLALAKTKNVLLGYTTPKPFDVRDTERAVNYDFQVVDDWLAHLRQYGGREPSLVGKNVLELGPGSDLGIGLLLLARGARRYNACDVNDLAKRVPDEFYEAFLARVQSTERNANLAELKKALTAARSGSDDGINYVVRDDFDLVKAFGPDSMDLVFSQAAFEHFDDIDATVAQLTAVCKPGAMIVAEIDLMTHSRWIRDKDPNNIYRYPELIYRLFSFRGMPNRVRPYRYRKAFERNGWSDIRIIPRLTRGDHRSGASGMSRAFRDDVNEMGHLTIVLCATKDGAQ